MSIYGKTLLFKRGKMLAISLTYSCNLSCSYCSLEMPTGRRPRAKTSTLEEWKDFIVDFTDTHKIREIYVSGGEPTLLPYFAELTNWLLSQGFHVTVFTNLKRPEVFQLVKRSHRLRIQATYHHSDYPQGFYSSYCFVVNQCKHFVTVDEIGDTKMFPFSTLKPFIDMDGLKDGDYRVSPDLEVFIGCYNHFVGKS